jgi:cyanophycinase
LCGGRDARIAVIPTASKLADTGERYEELFGGSGRAGGHARLRDPRRWRARTSWRDPAPGPGVFFTGGNQLRLSTILGGTPWPRLIRERNATACRWAAPAPAPASSAST